MKDTSLAIYQADNGAIELSVDARHETIWATQRQMAEVFGVDVRTVNEHLGSIYTSGELQRDPTIRKFRIVQTEGNRQVERQVDHYNLDAVISVGYRVNSKQATKFRQWATKTLHSYVTQGFVVDRDRVQFNLDSFLKAVEDIKLLGVGSELVNKSDVLELVKTFAGTWFSLEAYDKSALPESGATRESVAFTADELTDALGQLKAELVAKNEATELFAQPRQSDGLEAIIGNIFQTFDGQDVYPTVEEKAAHLLYFVVKNHVFTDGNKRSGAFAFVWFLHKTGLLRHEQMTPTALTALTLLVAESDPRQKERIVGLVLLLLKS